MKKDERLEIIRRLRHPALEARGYTRWWWFGGAVTKEEIARELDLMAEAQIGGVELQIIYPIYPDNEEKGIQNQFYLSPGFFELIRFACGEAKKRGMVFDMTLGSSWPYGGPFVPKELSAPNVIPYMLDVKGPASFHYDFTTRVYGTCVGCIMGRMKDCRMLPESIVDLTDQVVDKYLFGWEWGLELKEISVPKGDYKIVLFVSNDKRQTVLKPLPGGEGLIIDHNRKDALRHFLRHGGDPIAEQVGEGMINSFFCDSLEVFGQNWTDIIYEEFRNRRGYELRPWLYALWGEVEGCTGEVRYDFNKTLAELTEENFFGELTKWCHEKGTTSRVQAHGTWGDVLRCYGTADIPEGETFSQYDKYEVNTVHRRLASSAGHVYGKPVISNESFTWLRFPRFVVTLENLKAAADSIYLDGMNHIVNHGFAYSPKDSGKLGWPFYASTQINHKNTWWPFYKVLGAYINRMNEWLRMGEPVVRIAVYLPQSDIWAENPLSDIHMCMKLEERMTTRAVDAIQKAGYWFDFVNDDVVERFSEYGYEALILLECERMPLETARAMAAYAEKGGILICKGELPRKACGRMGYEEETRRIQKIFREMKQKGTCVQTADRIEGMIEELQKRVEPDVRMRRHSDVVGYVHRADERRDVYFVSNISEQWVTEEIRFSRQEKGFAVFDPLTAAEKRVDFWEYEDGGVTVEVTLEPFGSLLFVFDGDCEERSFGEGAKGESARDMGEVWMDLSLDWSLEVPEVEFEEEFAVLEGWEQVPGLKYFSGEGIYRKEIFLDMEDWARAEATGEVWLVLEHLGEAAEIFVNGMSAGILFKRPYRVEIGKLLTPGGNLLEIRVRNLLINCAIDPEYPEVAEVEPVIDRWPYSTGRINLNREEWIYNTREREMVKEPVGAGIWGGVWVVI